ncbi:MAG: hypothetical protein IT249_08735 [Chitinophagaceae bacterium]|nr:hypothetical protein [Chitinophagaceae bacterium]
MKLFLSKPDETGGSFVNCDFEKALAIIQQVDELTLQTPKIIYLVGWQYKGHDDQYPAFFEVNPLLKRKQDITASESLQWLMIEARKHHTTVSLHINMTDAYDDSPSWETYVKNDLISKNRQGDLLIIGNYNNRKAYQVNYRNEWEKGYTQKRIDSLFVVVPQLKQAGTIHADAWIARESPGHYESAIEEAKYQVKAARYWQQKGVDITSEWVMDYMTGVVPFAWHFNNRGVSDYLSISANIYTGSGLNPDLKWTDFGLGFLFGTSMYGEDIFPKKDDADQHAWVKLFNREFYLNCLQYFYLNRYKRLSVQGEKNERKAFFSDSVVVSLADSSVYKGDTRLRNKNFVCFPVVWKEEKMLAVYADADTTAAITIPLQWGSPASCSIYEVTPQGKKLLASKKLKKGQLLVQLKKEQPYIIEPGKN